MKYMGSKTRIKKDIIPIITESLTEDLTYIEPFAGGMNVICDVKHNKRVAIDNNRYLIAMWKALVSGWYPEKISKELYLRIRSNFSEYPDHLVGWAGFNCSYSGKWFGGFAGEVKTKTGVIRDYQREAINNVITQTKKMLDVTFIHSSFLQVYNIPPKSVLYCDPPYKGTTGYHGTPLDHTVFWEWVRQLHREGHSVFVSEYTAPEDFLCIWEKPLKSSLSANGKSGGSKHSVERLFIPCA